MRRLSHAWRTASPIQRIVVGLVLLVAIGATTAVGVLHPSPFVSPEPSIAPDLTAPTLTAATLTSEDEEIGLPAPTQVISLNGEVSEGPAARDSTPTFAFRSDEAGTITYAGACQSHTTTAVAGLNTLTFDFLPAGFYFECAVQVRDAAGNISVPLSVDP